MKVGQLALSRLTIEDIAEIAIQKAGNKRKLCKAAGISRTTLDSILNGTLRRRSWSRTVGKLTNYALNDNSNKKEET